MEREPVGKGAGVPDAHVLAGAADMQAVDRRAIALGADGFALMRRAGEAVARHVRRRVDPGARVVVVAGAGNNGGDGAVAARRLERDGHDVLLVRAGGEPREGSDAARAFALHEEAGGRASGADGSPRTLVVPADAAALPDDVAHAIAGAELLVDALLGAGLSRDVDGVFAALVRAMDASAAPVLAIDLPSGLDGDEHLVRGVAARARWTVSFVRLKRVHCLQPGRALCGEIAIEDIGMPDAALEALPGDCRLNAPALWRDALRPPSATAHKFRRGHVLVRGGAAHRTGAARLAASAALHAGAGLVTLACPREALAVAAAQLTAVMLDPCDDEREWRERLADERIGAVVVGPANGLGEATRRAVDAALDAGRPCVLDADALSCHADDPARFLERLRRRGGVAGVVLTPHDGELARVFGHTDALARPSRLHRARAAAALAGCVIVSKGPDTVVAAPDGRASIAVNAPPWLATAGAGDVLAGVVAALLAQGTAPFEAASAAVWLHGQAARALRWPITAEVLAPEIARALGELVALAPPPLPRLALPGRARARPTSAP